MRCYRHQEHEAVGICRGCGKGVCDQGCATDLGHGLSCSEACTLRIGRVDALNRRADAAYGLQRKGWWLGPALFGVFGVVCAYFGWQDRERFNPLTILGLAFLAFCIALLWPTRRWARMVR